MGNVNAEMDNRMQARVLEAFLYAKKINAPSAAGNNWDSLLQSSLDKILSTQGADGGFHFAASGGYAVPFMVGMLDDALIDYYTTYRTDPRILTAVKKVLDYLWSKTWDERSRSFMYIEGDYAGERREPAPDLNNLILNGFGWVYCQTGDTTYRDRGDVVLSGAVKGAWLDGSKQFNQAYTMSYKYAAFRKQGEGKR
jgi:hypothetical protein